MTQSILVTGCSSGIGAALSLLQASPPLRVRGGKGSTLYPLLKQLLPVRWFNAILSRKFGLSGWPP